MHYKMNEYYEDDDNFCVQVSEIFGRPWLTRKGGIDYPPNNFN